MRAEYKQVFFYFSVALLGYAIVKLINHSPWKFSDFLTSFQKDAGHEVLPMEIQDMKRLAVKNSIESFVLSGELSSDSLLRQRAVEFLYPVKMLPDAKMIFAIQSSPFSKKCKLLATEGVIYLYEC